MPTSIPPALTAQPTPPPCTCPPRNCPHLSQSFSYVSSDASVSRLLSELQGLTSLQLLDILSPAMVPGQGLVVRARELAK